MNIYYKKLLGIVALFVLCHGWSRGEEVAGNLDYSVDPKPKDNFLEADFRMASQFPSTAPEAIVVYLPGTDWDGRNCVSDPDFLELAKTSRAVLMGCNYRGEGLEYNDPAGGSGRALEEAISHFAGSLHHVEWARLPLILVGYSEGGIFTFNYVCWRPERVKAFAALKAVSLKYQPKADSYQVPGLLAVGERDEPERIRSLAKAFLDGVGKHSKWALVYEKGIGHEFDPKTFGFATQFLKAACADSAGPGLYYNVQTLKPASKDLASLEACWFPDQRVVEAWKGLHRPVEIKQLVSMPERKQLATLVDVQANPRSYECDTDAHEEGVIRIAGSKPGVIIDSVRLAGEGFSLNESRPGTLPVDIPVNFTPRGAWGPVKAEVEITGSWGGETLEPISLFLTGMAQGPLNAVPSTLYLGGIKPEGALESQVRLLSNHRPFHVSEIKVHEGISATIEDQTADGATLRIRWEAGKRLGRMHSEILVEIDSPQVGVLRIPVLGFVAR